MYLGNPTPSGNEWSVCDAITDNCSNILLRDKWRKITCDGGGSIKFIDKYPK